MHEANDFGRTDAVRIGNGVVEGVIAEVGWDGDVDRVVRICRGEYVGVGDGGPVEGPVHDAVITHDMVERSCRGHDFGGRTGSDRDGSDGDGFADGEGDDDGAVAMIRLRRDCSGEEVCPAGGERGVETVQLEGFSQANGVVEMHSVQFVDEQVQNGDRVAAIHRGVGFGVETGLGA